MKSAFSALFLAASLTGCATSWVVDSDVKSFASPGAIAPGATYRFDRLPSQQADFRSFYRDAHAVECLTDREKMLIGLTVAMMRLCDP